MLIGLHSPYWGSVYGGGEKYLGVTAETIRDFFPGNQIEIGGAVPADRRTYERRLGLDLHGIELSAGNRVVTPVHHLLNRAAFLRPLRDRYLAAQAARATSRYDLYMAMAYRIPVHSRARRGAILCQFPYPSREGVDEFQLVICQSDYVRDWVRRYWGVDATVVHPPVDRPAAEPDLARKERLILSIGRFFAGGHSKRHDIMVEAFRRLCDSGLEGWRLALAGSVHRGGPHAGYLESIERLAAGYPVDLHLDVPGAELEDLYARASIYWHAAGYGAGDDAPEQREHFGITVAEAMARGAVPVVHRSGGVLEVVADGSDGLFWSTPAELESTTRRLTSDPDLRLRLGAAARASSERFATPRFRERMAEALRPFMD